MILLLFFCTTTLSSMTQSSYLQLMNHIQDYRIEINNCSKYHLKFTGIDGMITYLERSYLPFYKKAPTTDMIQTCLEKFKGIQSISQQDMANVIGYTYAIHLYDLTLALIELWQDNIDINLPSETFDDVCVGREILQAQIEIAANNYHMLFLNSQEFIKDHLELYKFVIKKFKYSIFRSLKGFDRKNFNVRKIIQNILSTCTDQPEASTNLSLLLLEVLETFRTDPDLLANIDASDMYLIKESDSCEQKQNKEYIREILKKYSFEKPKLSPKSHDCFFTYKKYYDTTH